MYKPPGKRSVHRPGTILRQLIVAAALTLAASGAVSQAHALTPPYLGAYINLDGRFYQVYPNTGGNLWSYFGLTGGGFAYVAEGAQMALCTHTDINLTSPMVYYYGYTDPALGPIASANFRTYSNSSGWVAVLSLHTVYGDTTCYGEVAAPPSYGRIFENGFDG